MKNSKTVQYLIIGFVLYMILLSPRESGGEARGYAEFLGGGVAAAGEFLNGFTSPPPSSGITIGE